MQAKQSLHLCQSQASTGETAGLVVLGGGVAGAYLRGWGLGSPAHAATPGAGPLGDKGPGKRLAGEACHVQGALAGGGRLDPGGQAARPA